MWEMTSRDQDQPWQLHLVKTSFSVHFRKGYYHITLWRRAYLFLAHFGSTNKERQKNDASLSIIIRRGAPYSGDGGESGGGPCPEWPIPTIFRKKKRRRKEKKSSSFRPCPANKDFFFKLFSPRWQLLSNWRQSGKINTLKVELYAEKVFFLLCYFERWQFSLVQKGTKKPS